MRPLDERGKAVAALLADRHEFMEALGKGGFADVYLARNKTLERLEALKVLREAKADDEAFRKRFLKEARVAAGLEHPGIVRVYDFGETAGYFWYSMQYIDGPTVARELKVRGRLTEEKAARIASAILDALAYAHARGVVHRDIKPDNIILDEAGAVFLMDFGIAKREDDLVKTEAGMVFGSPAYISPEQLRGKELDGRSDVYALGATLYEMLAGQPPFLGADKVSAMMARLSEDPPPLTLKRKEISPVLEQIVLKALARDREQRYESARAMREEIEAFLSGSPLPTDTTTMATRAPSQAIPAAPEPTPPTPPAVEQVEAARPRRRFSRLILVTAAAGMGALVAGSLLLLRPSTDQGGSALEVARIAAQAQRVLTAKAATPTPAPELPSDVGAGAPGPEAAVAEPPPPEQKQRGPAPRKEPEPTSTPRPRTARYPPELEELAEHALPAELDEACRGKSVGVRVVVDEKGALKEAVVISPVSQGCDAAALETVRKSRFKAGLAEDGLPVEGRFALSVRF